MSNYKFSPYAEFVENRLFPQTIQYGIFHRLTGEVVLVSEQMRTFLLAHAPDRLIPIDEEAAKQQGTELSDLIEIELLIQAARQPLSSLLDYYLVKPMQNPAVSYRSQTDETVVVRTSMRQRQFAPAAHRPPVLFEEALPPLAAKILFLADGAKTLRQVWSMFKTSSELIEDKLFSEAVNYLTGRERQLIKLAPPDRDQSDPFDAFNLVPRDLCVTPIDTSKEEIAENVIDFHKHGIDDASWEFDWIEATVNHSLRFPTPILGGLSYGARFCEAILEEIGPTQDSRFIEMLEVGGGTGSFARTFLDHAAAVHREIKIKYSLVDLSPTLFAAQQEVLSKYLPKERHVLQDAANLDLHGQTFDLIVANEVIADLPVASVERSLEGAEALWTGEGAASVRRFSLADQNTPAAFLVNQGVFEFIERIWQHLAPGGTAILSEYGGMDLYPARTHHLNHDEYSIHFGHLARCAQSIGFKCRILSLKNFLSIDECVEVLAGQEEHILCLNHVLNRSGVSLPYAIIPKADFENRVGLIAKDVALSGYSFTPLARSYHYGPTIDQFFVAIMKKPASELR